MNIAKEHLRFKNEKWIDHQRDNKVQVQQLLEHTSKHKSSFEHRHIRTQI